jgi:outer membrane receptor for ferrienterochelin and colicins
VSRSARAVRLTLRRCAWIPAFWFYAHAFAARAQTTPEVAPGPPPLAATPPPRSEPEAAPIETGATEDMIVTATRLEEPARESLVKVDVIRREEIERSGARNAAELLEERAGVNVTRSFAGSALWLRGLDPKYTLILVDGDRVPGQINGSIDLTRFTSENIERIEVVRGPGSALYGSDAIGGVVNVITRQSTRPFEADGSVVYGTRNALDASARIAAQVAKPLHAQVTGGYHRADAFETEYGSRGSAFEEAIGGLRLWYQPDVRDGFLVGADYLRQTFEGSDEGAGGAVLDRTQLQEQFRGSLEHRFEASSTVQLVSRGTYSLFRDQYLSDQRGASELDQYEDNREHLGQLTSLLSVEFSPAHKTTFGLEHIFQRFDSERLEHRGNRYRLSPFAQHAWQVWKHGDSRFDLVPGVRLDVDSQFGTVLSPKLAIQYTPVEALVLRASYGRGFRAPSFQELLLRFENPSVGYFVAGNPNLTAEKSHGVDVGATWTPVKGLELATAFFRNDLTDMIAIVSGPMTTLGTMYTYENLTTAWTMGVESSVSWRVGEILVVDAGHTFMATHDGENDRVLEGRAKHRLNGAVRVAYPDWGLELGGRIAVQLGRVYFVPDARDVERKTDSTALTQLDVRLSKHFTEHLEIAAGVDNLLDAGDRFALLRPLTVYGSIGGRY